MSYSGYRTVTRKGGITVPFVGGVFLCFGSCFWRRD
jgi:hypothetical protein